MRFLPGSLLIFAATLLAQQGPPPDRMSLGVPALTELTAYLTLTDSQVTQLTDLRKQLRDAISPLTTQVAEKRKALADLRKAGNSDSATMTQLEQDLEALRKQISDTAKPYGDSARALLNTDQQTKLQALEDAAKLLPTVRQAEAVGLIAGPGPFGGMMGGPGGPMRGGARMTDRRPPR